MSSIAKAPETVAVPGSDQPLPDDVPSLTSLYMYISGACNLACRHCWITPSFDPDGVNTKHLRLEYAAKAIREAKPLGLNYVKLTGGEPLLHPHFKELVVLIHQEGLRCDIETNGTLIDQDMAEFLSHKITFISTSMDGASQETHEYMRAVDGSYEKVVNGIKALVAVGLRPQVIFTIHQGNVHELEDIVDLAQNLQCNSVKFNIVQRVGRGQNFANQHGLEIPQIIDLAHQVERELVPRSSIRIFFDIPIAFQPLSRFLRSNIGKCSVQNILGVLASGELSLCGIGVTTPGLIFGHLETDDIGSIWRNNETLRLLRTQIPDQLEGVCARCIHKNFCQGHCIANNYYTTHKLNSPYNFCKLAEEAGIFPPTRLC